MKSDISLLATLYLVGLVKASSACDSFLWWAQTGPWRTHVGFRFFLMQYKYGRCKVRLEHSVACQGSSWLICKHYWLPTFFLVKSASFNTWVHKYQSGTVTIQWGQLYKRSSPCWHKVKAWARVRDCAANRHDKGFVYFGHVICTRVTTRALPTINKKNWFSLSLLQARVINHGSSFTSSSSLFIFLLWKNMVVVHFALVLRLCLSNSSFTIVYMTQSCLKCHRDCGHLQTSLTFQTKDACPCCAAHPQHRGALSVNDVQVAILREPEASNIHEKIW